MRYLVYALMLGVSVLALLLGLAGNDFGWGLLALAAPLALLGTWDLLQTRHNLLRNYPLMAHLRWLLEAIRPQIHQYFIESDTDGRPFDHNARSIVYERAKNVIDKKPFGTGAWGCRRPGLHIALLSQYLFHPCRTIGIYRPAARVGRRQAHRL